MKKMIIALAIVALATTGGVADSFWTGAIDNDWSTAGNWSNDVPPFATDTAYVEAGTASITSPVGSIGTLYLGSDLGVSTLNISADITVSDSFYLSRGSELATVNQTAGNVVISPGGAGRIDFGDGSGQGTYNLSGGTLTTAGDWDDWGNKSGSSFTFNQTGGTYTDTGDGSLRIGYESGSVAEFNVSAGTFNASNSLTRIGDYGSATMTLSGSAVMNVYSGTLMVGAQNDTDPASTLNVQDDAVINSSAIEIGVGHYTSGTGIMNVSSNGVVQAGDYISIGRSGTGTLNLSENGAINGSLYLFAGRWSGGSGTVNMSGGSITLTNDGSTVYVGNDGDGAFYHSGGVITADRLRLCDDPDKGESGFYSISGGSLLTTQYISTGYDGVFEVYGSGATTIQSAHLSVGGVADTIRFVLDENGSTLITIDKALYPTRSGQVQVDDAIVEIDTTETFNGGIGSVYNLAWGSDGVLTNSAVFSVLSDVADFEMSILENVDQSGNPGTGSMLQVTVTGVSYFPNWLSQFDLGTETNYLDDADGDEVDNLREYAWGGDPSDDTDGGGNTPVYSLTEDSGTNYFEYVYYERDNAASLGLTTILDEKASLTDPSWVDGGPYEVGSGPSGVPGFTAVTNWIPVDGAAKFIRLQVELNE